MLKYFCAYAAMKILAENGIIVPEWCYTWFWVVFLLAVGAALAHFVLEAMK